MLLVVVFTAVQLAFVQADIEDGTVLGSSSIEVFNADQGGVGSGQPLDYQADTKNQAAEGAFRVGGIATVPSTQSTADYEGNLTVDQADLNLADETLPDDTAPGDAKPQNLENSSEDVSGPEAVNTSRSLNLSGSWNLSLTGEAEGYLHLDLNQVGDALFGSGEIAGDNATKEVAASGFVVGRTVDIEVVTVDGKRLYSLQVSEDAGVLAGTFDLLDHAAATLTGSATSVDVPGPG